MCCSNLIRRMEHELKRSEVLLKLEQARKEGIDIKLREIEGKSFDSTVVN